MNTMRNRFTKALPTGRHSSWVGVLAATALTLGVCTARADGDTGAPPPPPPSPAPAPPQSEVHLQIGGAPLQPVQPGHDVRVTSDSEGARLIAVDTSGLLGVVDGTLDGPRQEVCVAPCTAKLSPSTTYIVRGWGLTDSPHFGISDQTTEVKVHAGSAVVSALGGTSLTLGVIGVVGGAALIPFALAQDQQHASTKHTFLTAGGAAIGAGAALFVLGLALGFVSTTHIYDGQGARLAKGPLQLTPSGLVF
jgi:hypothetical protein